MEKDRRPATCKICSWSDPAAVHEHRPIFQTARWCVLLHGLDQRYLGRCLVVTRRHVPSLSDLDLDEWGEMRSVMTALESATRSEFGADLANWGCLMNHAFQQEPAEPHVHWHLRPRYRNQPQVEGVDFADAEFSQHYERDRRPVSGDVAEAIAARLQGAIEAAWQSGDG